MMMKRKLKNEADISSQRGEAGFISLEILAGIILFGIFLVLTAPKIFNRDKPEATTELISNLSPLITAGLSCRDNINDRVDFASCNMATLQGYNSDLLKYTNGKITPPASYVKQYGSVWVATPCSTTSSGAYGVDKQGSNSPATSQDMCFVAGVTKIPTKEADALLTRFKQFDAYKKANGSGLYDFNIIVK